MIKNISPPKPLSCINSAKRSMIFEEFSEMASNWSHKFGQMFTDIPHNILDKNHDNITQRMYIQLYNEMPTLITAPISRKYVDYLGIWDNTKYSYQQKIEWYKAQISKNYGNATYVETGMKFIRACEYNSYIMGIRQTSGEIYEGEMKLAAWKEMGYKKSIMTGSAAKTLEQVIASKRMSVIIRYQIRKITFKDIDS